MRHCDPDDLALRALGEPAGTAADDEHLAVCRRCQRDLDELRAVVTVGRSVSAQDPLVAPPDQVWDRITGELGLGRSADTAPDPPRRLLAVPAPAGDAAAAAPGRRRWRSSAVLLAAAVVAGLLAGVGLASLRDPSPGGGPAASQKPGEPSVLAQAPLQPLRDVRVEGSAVLTEDGGRRSIEVALSGLPEPAPGSYYEVWLIDRDVARLVSLGPLDEERTTFLVPAGLDIATYPVLDVSVEPLDGDPKHSSVSVARGILPV